MPTFEKIDTPSCAVLANFDAIIDVRSPSEFEADHIPGAINLPVLNDAERAEVGTIYVQDSRFKARRVGAAYVSQNIAGHLTGKLADRPRDFRPLVYCWRGGMRSNSLATILGAIGWRGSVIAEGYQAWRRVVVAELRDAGPPFNLLVLDGQTGSGKTKILELLSQRGVQALDLEGLANHRGSVFGGFASAPQPAQKLFESLVWNKLSKFDRTKPIVVEAESSLIGRLSVPDRLMKSIRTAPRIEVRVGVKERAQFLHEAYGDIIASPERLASAIERLRPYHATTVIESWLEFVRTGQHEQLACELMQNHYDPLYTRQRNKREDQPLALLPLADLRHNSLVAAAEQITDLVSQKVELDSCAKAG